MLARALKAAAELAEEGVQDTRTYAKRAIFTLAQLAATSEPGGVDRLLSRLTGALPGSGPLCLRPGSLGAIRCMACQGGCPCPAGWGRLRRTWLPATPAAPCVAELSAALHAEPQRRVAKEVLDKCSSLPAPPAKRMPGRR